MPKKRSSCARFGTILITRSSVSFMSEAINAQSSTDPSCISAESTAGWSSDGTSRKYVSPTTGLGLAYRVLRRQTDDGAELRGASSMRPSPPWRRLRARSRSALASSAHWASWERILSRRASPEEARPGTQSAGNATRTSANCPACTVGAVSVTTGSAASDASRSTLPSSGPWPQARKFAIHGPVFANGPCSAPANVTLRWTSSASSSHSGPTNCQ